jgi:hypothetical protein
MLPVPSLSEMDWREAGLMTLALPFDRVKRLVGGIPLPREALWPRQLTLAQQGAAAALPIPAESVFEIREGLRALMQTAPPSHHAEQTGLARHETAAAEVDYSRHLRGRPHLARTRQHRLPHLAGHTRRPALHGRNGPLKHLVQVKKKNV